MEPLLNTMIETRKYPASSQIDMDGQNEMEFRNSPEPYIVAEVGGNHGGEIEMAKRYIREAAEAGVDAVKFQLYRGERLIVADEPPLPHVSDEYDSQQERFQDLQLSMEEWDECVHLAENLGVDFAASAFDPEMVDFVAETSPFVKIASGDLTHIPLLRYVAETGCPVVLSTGCATMEEIETAVTELAKERLVLLHCVSSYPTPEDDANLGMMDRLRKKFDVPVGYSDHTAGSIAATAAAARGACFIEKHFTLDSSGEGGDHSLSATPEEMARIVGETRRIAAIIGDEERGTDTTLSAETNCQQMRRGLATVRPIEAGDRIEESDLTALRPGRGVSPLEIDTVTGTRATQNLPRLTIIDREDYELG